jgi:rubrerythrin/rhodanese-related sulfurtransferase
MSDTARIDQVTDWPVERLRDYLLHHHPDDYQLIDVRQLQEYGGEHLPGAIWIPAEELPGRLADLDPARACILYCSFGSLSRAAAQLLVRAGFGEVHVLRGGLHSWYFGSATGLPEQFSAHLADAGSAANQAVLAWRVEETTRRFYEEMADTIADPQVSALFADLAAAESRHKATLKALWEALAGRPAGNAFPGPASPDLELMEGGTRLAEALAWAAQSSTARILDFAMALELNAYDHFLYLQRHAGDPDSRRLYEVMAEEERFHLRSLGKSMENLQR